MLKKLFIATLLSSLAIPALSADKPNSLGQLLLEDDGDEVRYCQAKDLETVDKCPDGKLMLFAPSVFGNEQLPLVLIARSCDEKRPIYFNVGGVVCTKVSARKGFDPNEEQKGAKK